ncbi:hypothetical protein [Lactococcus lactis]|uniref:hypothetical protein n=1 Tax=Lactococcus lactis TaxID=1358 RepID=UPI0025A04F32|nr:hypothetical protein [Lactococcus lactis]MDM7659492.1 hypothetical protein [Lactococcus lactis]
MSELETAQELAETAVRQVNVFALQGDKVDFLINQLKQIASLPQLTILKSIADELDKVPFHNPKENGYICVAYLAGKALGVDLVKVVEG